MTEMGVRLGGGGGGGGPGAEARLLDVAFFRRGWRMGGGLYGIDWAPLSLFSTLSFCLFLSLSFRGAAHSFVSGLAHGPRPVSSSVGESWTGGVCGDRPDCRRAGAV